MFSADPNQADEWQVLVVGRASEEQCESEDVVLGVGEPSIGRDIAEFAKSPICTPSNENRTCTSKGRSVVVVVWSRWGYDYSNSIEHLLVASMTRWKEVLSICG